MKYYSTRRWILQIIMLLLMMGIILVLALRYSDNRVVPGPGGTSLSAGGANKKIVLKKNKENTGPPSHSGRKRISWIKIPGGRFIMGSNSAVQFERPKHSVTVKTFRIMKTEVTASQYKICVEEGECRAPSIGKFCPEKYFNWNTKGREKHPINCVSWKDARSFCIWIGGRLPSEAEWEYAARGGGKLFEFAWGNEEANCSRAAMRGGTGSKECGTGGTWPVCSKRKGNTKHQLCDMAGNVWEWVEDCWHKNYLDAPVDGSAWTSRCHGNDRINRGGSWDSGTYYMRATFRYKIEPNISNLLLGFRCVKNL